jgi:pantetheine-phosphate adenylyltransferase
MGHVDIATRAAGLFDELVVGVYDRPLKNLLFSPEERYQMTRDVLANIPNVRVERYAGLTVEFARQQNATVIVRGLRAVSDFEWELQLALTNRNLNPKVDTVCLMASQKYLFLSSSVVKEVAFAGGDVSDMVPEIVLKPLLEKILALGGDGGGKVKAISVRD